MAVNSYQSIRDFESALCEYTGAPWAVATNSCTNAMLISLDLHYMKFGKLAVGCPTRTYCSVPQVIMQSGHQVVFRDVDWVGSYELTGTSVIDSARLLTGNMYRRGTLMCLSFHWTKHLALGLAGAVLCDSHKDYLALRKLRFDGRTEGVSPDADDFYFIGRHCTISPALAAEGVQRLNLLPQHNYPLPNSPYPDLSTFPAFRG